MVVDVILRYSSLEAWTRLQELEKLLAPVEQELYSRSTALLAFELLQIIGLFGFTGSSRVLGQVAMGLGVQVLVQRENKRILFRGNSAGEELMVLEFQRLQPEGHVRFHGSGLDEERSGQHLLDGPRSHSMDLVDDHQDTEETRNSDDHLDSRPQLGQREGLCEQRGILLSWLSC
jgi:hypothetical protein